MFVVAVTRRESPTHLPGGENRVFRHGNWNITVETNSSAVIVEQNDSFRVIESPLACFSQASELPVATVEFGADRQELRIAKPLHSGRPVYFHQNPACEFFCSTDITGLRKCGVRLQAEETALPEFLVYRYLVPPATLYKSVSQLPLGANLRIKLKGEDCAIGEIERWSAPEPCPDGPPELGAEMVSRLTARVQKLSPLREQLAVLLSGGLDSTALFRTAQKLFNVSESYSTGFPFNEVDKNVERQYAESAAAALGGQHHYFQTTPEDYLHGFLSAIAAAEQPVHHLQSVLLYLLFEKGLPRDKKVVMCGEGADGIFGVDSQRRLWRREHKNALFALLSLSPLSAAMRCLTTMSGRGSGLFEPVLSPSVPGTDFENREHELWAIGSYGSRAWVLERFGCDSPALFRTRLELVNRFRNRSLYDIISLLSLMGEGAMTQAIWSKLGQACGRFVDYSFLDPELLLLAYRTSWKLKLREPKALVRGALRRMHVPEFIINRPKSSFGLNYRGWALKGGIFEAVVPLAAKVFPERELRSLQSEEWSKASTFWTLLNYALWKRLCVDGESLESLQEELASRINSTEIVPIADVVDACFSK